MTGNMIFSPKLGFDAGISAKSIDDDRIDGAYIVVLPKAPLLGWWLFRVRVSKIRTDAYALT